MRSTVLCSFALLAGCAGSGPAPEPPGHARLRAAIPPLQSWLETTRAASIGAPASTSVTIEPLHPHLRTVLPDATARRDRALLSAVDLLGPRREDREALLKGIHAEADASYEFAGRRLLLAAGADSTSAGFEHAAVHGLAHALQERRFRARQWLERLTPPSYDRRDETIAWALLLEGEATYLAALKTQKAPGPALRKRAEGLLAAGDLGKMIAALGPLGGSIVADLRARGGWELVDRVFRQRPQSTEQLLHPEKLVGKTVDAPVRFKLPDVSRALGKGWRLVAQDSLGELLLRVLFTKLTGKPQQKACAGWGGDRLQVYRHPHEVYCAFVWLTTWDTERDATEFALALRKAQKGAAGPLASAQIRVAKTDVWIGGLKFAQIDAEAPGKAYERAFRELRRSDRHPGVWHVPGGSQ